MIFKTLELQELFNLAYVGVIKQGEPSIMPHSCENPNCAYITDSGNKCGVGHTLTEDALSKLYGEELPVGDMLEFLEEFGLKTNIEESTEDFLDDLQQAHDMAVAQSKTSIDDNTEFLNKFRANMVKLAKHKNLTIPKVSAIYTHNLIPLRDLV